ncbi:MAG: LLM class flavin-dependent oxidoreductase [Chloroflexota bacterium]|nr:LLM class flavin-dependent oxidoreductase [Chloroflexota bacterium]
MTATSKAHFGVTVPQIKRTWEESSAAAREFESLGFGSIWVNDHLYGPQSPQIPILEAWSTVSALAAITERVEIGTLVTPAGMRNPAHLGKTIATADEIAGGRVIPGLGGGWMEREFTDFGVPFLSTRERLRQLEETVVLLKRMWSEEEAVTYEGKHVRVENLVCEPKPPRTPPILIGGAGERVTLRIAAEHADIYNNLAGHHSNLARKVEVLREHCADIGRDPSEIAVSQQCLVTIAPDEGSAAPMIERAQRIFGGHLGDPTGPLALSGSPERIRDQIAANREAGCDMFVIEFFGRDTREPARLFAEKVLPYV